MTDTEAATNGQDVQDAPTQDELDGATNGAVTSNGDYSSSSSSSSQSVVRATALRHFR